MRLADLFMNFQSFKPNLKTNRCVKIRSSKLLLKYKCNQSLHEFVNTTKSVDINSVAFKQGNVIQTDTEVDETPIFALIIEIILNVQEILLGCQKLCNIGFDNHLYAYVVEKEDFYFIKTINWKLTRSSYIFVGKEGKQLVKWD